MKTLVKAKVEVEIKVRELEKIKLDNKFMLLLSEDILTPLTNSFLIKLSRTST